MMERLIDSPIPMPIGLVVKKEVARVRDDTPEAIAEDRGGLLEGNSVLPQIGRGLLPIPFEIEFHCRYTRLLELSRLPHYSPQRACRTIPTGDGGSNEG